jgi:DNA (cytosine-5)-methyltransferase 1
MMPPAELKTIRNTLGLTQSGLSDALGLAKNGDRSIRRWESGSTTIPEPVAMAVKSLLHEKA